MQKLIELIALNPPKYKDMQELDSNIEGDLYVSAGHFHMESLRLRAVELSHLVLW